jgi:hypothetical protein
MWYYFRVGYSTYLTFLLGYASTLVTLYYLAIKNMPALLDIFPNFLPFAILSTLVGAPVSVLVGWIHFKRSPLFSSEADIATEANPYYFKVPPGYWQEVIMPFYLESLNLMKRLLEAQQLLPEEDRARIKHLEQLLDVLIRGGYVGNPRKRFT